MAAGYGYPAAPIAAPETLVARPCRRDRLAEPADVRRAVSIRAGADRAPALQQHLAAADAGMPVGRPGRPAVSASCNSAGHIAIGVRLFSGCSRSAGHRLRTRRCGISAARCGPRALCRYRRASSSSGCSAWSRRLLFGIVFASCSAASAATRHLLDVTAFGVPIHAIAGLGGWLTFTAIGVSYRLLAMFMLAPELEGRSTRGVLYVGTAALAVAIVGGVAAICIGRQRGGGPGRGRRFSVSSRWRFTARDILHLYRARKRRTIELNSRMAAVALLNLAGRRGSDRRPACARQARPPRRRRRLPRQLRLAVGARPRQALQDRGVPDLARMLRAGARQNADTARAGPRRRTHARQMVHPLFCRASGPRRSRCFSTAPLAVPRFDGA